MDKIFLHNRRLFGRRPIYTDEDAITRDNVLEVLASALATHNRNKAEIEYLHWYLRGDQPIRYRIKKVRKEICNKVVINRANEIVTFKTANFIGEPLQYVSRGSNPSVPAKIEQLNSFMLSEGKPSKDMQLAYWMFTCGVGYRLILNDKWDTYNDNELFDEAPFEIYTLDPRRSFVVRSSDVSERPLMGVTYTKNKKDGDEYTCYTKDTAFTIKKNEIVNEVAHNFGIVPIVEYQCNPLRMGAFEIVIDLLDAINLAESNRLDGIEQFVQALMVFENADISQEQFELLREEGAIKIRSSDGVNSKVYYLNEQLDQSQTQLLVDDLYQTVKEIVGIPSQGNANTSDSSNNGAVIMKNGWQNAEARAKETEGMWKQAETETLKIILKICNEANALDLKVSEIDQKFSRRNYEDQNTKTTSFTQLIGVGAPPIQAFKYSGLDIDPESAAAIYEKYKEEQQQKMEEQLNQTNADETIVTDNENKENSSVSEVIKSGGK